MAAVVVENRARKNKTIILLDGSRVPPIYPIKQKTSLFFITRQTLKSSLPKYYHQVLIQISICYYTHKDAYQTTSSSSECESINSFPFFFVSEIEFKLILKEKKMWIIIIRKSAEIFREKVLETNARWCGGVVLISKILPKSNTHTCEDLLLSSPIYIIMRVWGVVCVSNIYKYIQISFKKK